jgi:hypothetical protein
MPFLRFEPTILEFEQAKSVHALDRAANTIGEILNRHLLNIREKPYRLSQHPRFIDRGLPVRILEYVAAQINYIYKKNAEFFDRRSLPSVKYKNVN